MTPNYKAIPGGRKARERAKLATSAAPEVPHLTRAERRKAAREAGAEWTPLNSGPRSHRRLLRFRANKKQRRQREQEEAMDRIAENRSRLAKMRADGLPLPGAVRNPATVRK